MKKSAQFIVKIGFLLGALFYVSCASSPIGKSNTIKICSYLAEDLNYIQNSMHSNLAVYQFDADLKKRVDQAYMVEKENAKSCATDTDYFRTIRSYFSSFHDPHLQPWWQISEALKPMVTASLGHEIRTFNTDVKSMSTGIILKKISDGYYIRDIDKAIYLDNAVNIGDELISCDLKSVHDILTQEIIPYEQVSSPEAGLYRHAGKIFLRWDLPPEAVSNCKFKHQGAFINAILKWKPVASSYLSQFRESKGPIYSIEKTSYGHWVKLRSLAGYGDAETTLLKTFVRDARKLRGDKVVVLDLRGNSGGNSSWGDDWIKNLYGSVPKVANKPDLIFSSPGNIGHYERLFNLFDTTAGFSTDQDKKDFLKLIETMRAHPNQLTPLNETSKVSSSSKKRVLFKGKVYVVSDAAVFSSGELFLQSLRLMPRVIQVGIASDASTQAGDIRFDQTPNGLVFSIGTKVFQSIFIGRKPGEPVVPQIKIEPNAADEFKGKDSMREQIDKLISN